VTVIGDGWKQLADRAQVEARALDPTCEVLIEPDYAGTPRVRVRAQGLSRDERRHVIATLEAQAISTCEGCGGAGRIRAGAVLMFLCDDCVADR
jgi:hypothetical protein